MTSLVGASPEMASFGPGPPTVIKFTFGGQAGVLALWESSP
jgi:hypothetical protein